MGTFNTLRDRDAWATIRGYVYQVDLTIERWLTLSDLETLELERGEDIDLVGQAIEANEEQERDRLLTQVKHREATLSLRSHEALTAIACFVEHRTANPQMRLRFRFTTNATVTCERPAVFEHHTPAISVWASLQRAELPADEAAKACEKLRAFLRCQAKPEKLNEHTWGRFLSFVGSATDAELEATLRDFEWQTGQPDAQAMTMRIKTLLVEQGHASSEDTASSLYSRLFLHVFKTLCLPGVKVLTRASLVEQLAFPPLSSDARAMLARLEALHQDLEQQVAGHDMMLQQHSQAITRLQEYATRAGAIEAQVVFSRMAPSIQVPPLVKDASRRQRTVDSLIDIIRQHPWVAIHGPSGTGKTQLAVLVAEKNGQCAAWVRLSSDAARSQFGIVVLEGSLEMAAECPLDADRGAWYNAVCSRLEKNTLIVVDDSPRLTANDRLAEGMILLCQACQRHHLRLLTTSPHPLAPTTLERLAKDSVYPMEVPLLRNDEVAEILSAYGAPAEILKPAAVSFVNGICRQHPSLVVAAAQYLRDRAWRLAGQELSDLLGSKHTESVNQETLGRLLGTVFDAGSRELLERLTLIIHRFGTEEVKTVAVVAPPIERPFDRLDPLLGLWVQYDTNGVYLVSPLAKSLGAVNLSKDVQLRVNTALGDSVLRRKLLNQYDACNALIYYCGAEAWNKAGHVLVTSLMAMVKEGIPKDDATLLCVWIDSPLPTGMNLHLRFLIRTLQIQLRSKVGKSTAFLLDDLELLLSKSPDADGPSAFLASVSVAMALAGKEPEAACRNLSRAFGLISTLVRNKALAKLVDEMPVESLVWAVGRGIQSREQIALWLDAVNHLPSALRQKAYSEERAEIGCISLADGIWLHEAEKPQQSRNWSTVRASLADLASSARELNWELLWACAVRSQVVILAEYEKALDKAIAVAETALKEATDPRSRFLLQDCIARQFMYQERNDEALLWFAPALKEPVTSLPLARLHSYTNASVALGLDQYSKAAEWLQCALKVGLSTDDVPRTEVAKVAAELCVLRGLNQDLKGAYEALDIAVSNLMSDKEDTVQWKGLFMVVGHVSGYFTSIACTGQPPDKAGDGGPYAAPVRGMFLRYNEAGCASPYGEAKTCTILVQLAEFADAVGISDRAEHWALAGMEAARAADFQMAIEVLSLQIVPMLLISNRHAEALALAVECAAFTVAGVIERDRGGNFMQPGFDTAAVLGPKPSEAWNRAETNSVMFGLFPTVCKIAADSLDSPERAKISAQEIISACRQLAQTASHRELWQQAADLIDRAFVSGMSSGELFTLSNGLDDQKYGWLRMVGYVGATIQPDCSLEEACRTHLVIMPGSLGGIRHLSRMTYDRILVPWIVNFWQRKFQQQRFRFTSPRLVQRELAEAVRTDEAHRAQAVLAAVASSLSVQPEGCAAEWLRAGRTPP